MLKETPLHYFRGKEMILSGVARRFGRVESLIGHTLRFSIADKDDMRRIITVTSGAGIDQDETGHWTVTIPGTSMNRNNFPLREYWWELDILVDGDVSKARPLARGPFNIIPSPFAT